MENRNVLINYYNVLVNGKHIEIKISGWRNALLKARKHTGDLFGTNKVEILNLNTGEIVSLEWAEIQYIKWQNKKAQSAVNSATT